MIAAFFLPMAAEHGRRKSRLFAIGKSKKIGVPKRDPRNEESPGV